LKNFSNGMDSAGASSLSRRLLDSFHGVPSTRGSSRDSVSVTGSPACKGAAYVNKEIPGLKDRMVTIMQILGSSNDQRSLNRVSKPEMSSCYFKRSEIGIVIRRVSP